MINLESELAQTFLIQKNRPNELEILITIPKKFSYFLGHFPDFPVLPAVALIDITSYLIKNLILNQPDLYIKKIGLLKIKAAVKPGDQVKIEILEKDASSYSATWLTQENEPKKIADLAISF
ncbi:MAG: hypothetical protein WA160_15630 [Pseudobdellovibrio sp.]